MVAIARFTIHVLVILSDRRRIKLSETVARNKRKYYRI